MPLSARLFSPLLRAVALMTMSFSSVGNGGRPTERDGQRSCTRYKSAKRRPRRGRRISVHRPAESGRAFPLDSQHKDFHAVLGFFSTTAAHFGRNLDRRRESGERKDCVGILLLPALIFQRLHKSLFPFDKRKIPVVQDRLATTDGGPKARCGPQWKTPYMHAVGRRVLRRRGNADFSLPLIKPIHGPSESGMPVPAGRLSFSHMRHEFFQLFRFPCNVFCGDQSRNDRDAVDTRAVK